MEVGDKGICRLSIIPLRSEPSDRAEMVTQLLFGDHYEILKSDKDNKWIRIKIHYDGYEGWIDTKQHTQISESYYKQINNSDYKICTDTFANILYQKHQINIVIGSILPISTNELFKMEEQLAFNGEAKSLSQRRDYEFINWVSRKYLNTPYVWGGRSPLGIDCSGFVQNVFRLSGYFLPRDTSQQVNHGKTVTFEESQPGDLAFFSVQDKVAHVGIILEGHSIIHASGKVRIDQLAGFGIINIEDGKNTHDLSSIKRILKV